MKIAFPLLNENMLAKDFAHACYIGIYDYQENRTIRISLSGVDIKPDLGFIFNTLISQGLNSVVSPHYSYMSLRVFKENEIGTLKAQGTNIDENIRFFKENALKSFNVHESLQGSDCISECRSCNSTCSK